MFSKFQSLKPEKQERILNAAIKEFAKNGITDIVCFSATTPFE